MLINLWAGFYFQPSSIVIPHHNLVKDQRLSFLRQIARRRPTTRTIIIIGPDHFSPNQNQINIADREWNLSNGQLKFSDLGFSLPVSNSLVKNDHTIYNLLPDIKSVWPNAVIYPILIGQKVTTTALDPLLTQLSSSCHHDCLLIASVDFSHYLPATLAEVHDVFTIKTLQNLDPKSIMLSEVDSPQSLYLLAKYSPNKSFHLFAHTNSGYIARNPDIETTTHVFGYYSKQSFSKPAITTTTIIPHALDRSQNQTTLGDRFFYGTDKFTIDGSLPEFVIGQITSPSQIVKYYLPLDGNSFLRGPDKQSKIKQYFDSLGNQPNLIKDYFWGKLIYDR